MCGSFSLCSSWYVGDEQGAELVHCVCETGARRWEKKDVKIWWSMWRDGVCGSRKYPVAPPRV